MSAVSANEESVFFRSGAASRERWLALGTLVLFAALLAVVGPRHEPWFDESQAWMLGRDTTLWDLLAHRVAFEGTPGLWHALLWLAAHAGLPFSAMWTVSGAFALCAAWIILTRAPFPFWLRAGIVFSYFVAYQYAVVARGYALDLLAIPLIAATFADRLRRPILYGALIGFCAQANAHSFLIAAVLGAEFLVAIRRQRAWRRAQIAGIAIGGALAGLALLLAWPPGNATFASDAPIAGARAIMMIGEAFIDRWDIFSSSPPSELASVVGFVLSLLLLAPSFLLSRRAGVADIVCALFGVVLALSVLKYANAWHGGLIYLLWIFALWISWDALPLMSPARRAFVIASVAAIVFVNVSYTARAALRDIRESYSAGPAAARFLAQHLSPDAAIAAAGFKTFAVQPWFPANPFRNYRNGAPDAVYYVWESGESFAEAITPPSWAALVAGNAYDALLLSEHKLSPGLLARFATTARAAGYCKATTIPGGLIWKSYVRESDAMAVFTRCAGVAPPDPG